MTEKLIRVDREAIVLPDGSVVSTVEFELPKDHWIYGKSFPPPMPFRMGTKDPRRNEFNSMVRIAAKYAIKASTMNGRSDSWDPDAVVQNFVVAMLGYHTENGLDSDGWGNPNPIPEHYPGFEEN